MTVYITECDGFLIHPLYGEMFQTTTVLIRAIMCENPNKVEYFLKRQCDPNSSVCKKKILPLMVASYVRDKWKRLAIFKILLEHGADPALSDVEGRNCVMYACALSLRREVELLIKDCDYNLNAVDMYGDTILHVCAKTGNTEVMAVILREMLRYGKNISVQNKNHLTPLSLAVLKGNTCCAKLLHDAGAHPRLSELRGSFVRVDTILSKKSIVDAYQAGLAASGDWPANEIQFQDCKLKPRPATTPVTRKEVLSRLFNGRGDIGTGKDICWSHRGMRHEDSTALDFQSSPAIVKFYPARGFQKKSALSKKQSDSVLSPTIGEDSLPLTGEDNVPSSSQHYATSTDCINALLSSTAYERSNSPSFCKPSTSTVQFASEWLSSLTTYKQKTERYIESAKAAAAQNAAKQKTFPLTQSSTPSSTSSSSSLSQNILIRKRFVPRSTTTPIFRRFAFKQPDVCAV